LTNVFIIRANAPVETLPPVKFFTGATVTVSIVGGASQIPPPQVQNSVVLFTSDNVTTTVPLAFNNETILPKEALIQNATVDFKVTTCHHQPRSL
jgi:ADP-glucose pyrophosphorylase